MRGAFAAAREDALSKFEVHSDSCDEEGRERITMGKDVQKDECKRIVRFSHRRLEHQGTSPWWYVVLSRRRGPIQL